MTKFNLPNGASCNEPRRDKPRTFNVLQYFRVLFIIKRVLVNLCIKSIVVALHRTHKAIRQKAVRMLNCSRDVYPSLSCLYVYIFQILWKNYAVSFAGLNITHISVLYISLANTAWYKTYSTSIDWLCVVMSETINWVRARDEKGFFRRLALIVLMWSCHCRIQENEHSECVFQSIKRRIYNIALIFIDFYFIENRLIEYYLSIYIGSTSMCVVVLIIRK